MGVGIDYVAPPIRVAIAPSPARLALRSAPTGLPLVNGRTRQLDLPVANVGGTGLAAGTGVVSVHLPAGVTGATVAGSTVELHGREPADLPARAPSPARADVPLSLLLSAAPTGVPTSRPARRRAGAERTERLGDRHAAVHRPAPGRTRRSPGRTPRPSPSGRPRPCRCASRTRVTCPRRASPSRSAGPRVSTSGRRWSRPAPGPAPTGSTTVECTTGVIDAGAALDLPVGLAGRQRLVRRRRHR